MLHTLGSGRSVHWSAAVVLFVAGLLNVPPIHSASRFNVTSDDLDHCAHYIVDDGYMYKQFFAIRPDMQHPARNASHDLVHLKLYVHAEKDVHILLSGTVQPDLDEPVYEIVLDAGSETFSEIRSRLRRSPLATSRRANVIASNEVTPVVIRVTHAGRITVTLGNDSEPVLNATDNERTPVKFLSFASWRSGMWMAYFDCHPKTKAADGDGDLLEAVVDPLEKCERQLAKIVTFNVTSEGKFGRT